VIDSRGLPVTTASRPALEAYDAGARALAAWGRDALDRFEAATALDPGLALAHAGAAICHFLEERFPEARAAAERARQAAPPPGREASHVEAVARWVTGQLPEAERQMRAHLDEWPRDLVILQRLYFVWFWQGRFPEMLELTGRLHQAYGQESFALGLHAFALEEAGRLPEALAAADRALALNPRDAWAVHALAHTLYESAAFDDGVSRLPPATHPLTHLGWFRRHLVWHLALLHLARGDYDRARAMSRAAFERAPSSIAGDLHDSISLLWRQALLGDPVGDRWQPFAAIARERLARQGLLFHAAHLAMALSGAGDWETADRQLGGLRDRAPRDRSGLTGEVLVPLVEGIQGFARGDHGLTIARIDPIRGRIQELGGSRAQRDVFHDTLLEACFRAGRAERAGELLAERLARRPDHAWRARQPVGASPSA
jgi:tetratricopeptide (TPR) repeat protein